MTAHVTTDYVGLLATLDTETVTVAAMDATDQPPVSTVALSTLTGNLDTVTTTAEWDDITLALKVADFTGMDAADVTWFAICYDPGTGLEVVSSVEATTPITITSVDTVSFPTGVALAVQAADVADRIAALEQTVSDLVDRVDALENP